MITRKLIAIMALVSAISTVSYAQLDISLDIGQAIAASAAQNIGANSPQAKLAAAYGRFIPVSNLSADSAGNVTVQNQSGYVQSATISQTEAQAITGSIGINSAIQASTGSTNTITDSTINGSKIEYTVTVGLDGKYKVTYNILVKVPTFNIVIQTNALSASFLVTPAMVVQFSVQPPPTATPPPSTTSGGGAYSSPTSVPQGATATDGNSYFWQTYQGPGSSYYAVKDHGGTVTYGPLIVVGIVE